MKKVLILVLSSDFYPYDAMITMSKKTWDSIEIQNCETIFYCSQRDNYVATNHDNVMYFDVPNSLYDMGKKNLAMFEWALANKEFDYVLRVNASQYVDKKELVRYIQNLENENVFIGAKVTEQEGNDWYWGGCGFLFSKDVFKNIVDNKDKYNHSVMEDKSISYLINSFGLQSDGEIKSCSIDANGSDWNCISYCGKSKTFSKFEEIKDLGHIVYRVKQDNARYMDGYIMEQLHNYLQ